MTKDEAKEFVRKYSTPFMFGTSFGLLAAAGIIVSAKTKSYYCMLTKEQLQSMLDDSDMIAHFHNDHVLVATLVNP
jgi:hypothetical protein